MVEPQSIHPIHRSQGAATARSSWVRRSLLLGSEPDEALDRLTRLTARALGAPMAAVGVVLGEQLLVVSQVGMEAGLGGTREMPLGATLSAIAVETRSPLVIADAASDPRVPESSPVARLAARAYAAVPLIRADGDVVGVLAVMEPAPREWAPDEIAALDDLSASVLREIEWRIERGDRVRAAEMLRQNEERYRLMVESGEHLFFYTVDVDGRFEYVSPSVRAVLGYEPRDLLGRTYHTIFAPEARLAPAERSAGQWEEERPTQSPVIARHRNGGRLVLETVESAVRRGGRVVGVQGLARDVTDRRNAEEAVRRSERHFRSLIEHSADVIDIVDADGTLRYVTPSVTRVLGYQPEELIGRSLFEIVHPDDRARATDAFHERLVTADGRRTVEVRVRNRDGEWRVFEATSRNLLDDPAVGGVVVTSRDITARKAAAATLQRNAVILAAIPDAVFVTDLEGRITYWNAGAAALFGWTEAEALGTCFAGRFPEDLRARFAAESERVAAGEEHFGEHVGERSDGTRFLMDVSARPILDESGEVVAVLRIARDITEQRLLARILDDMPEAALCLDTDDRIISFNAAALRAFGYTPEEFLGQHVRILAPDAAHRPAKPVPDILALIRRDGGWSGEVVRRRKDGSHFPALLTAGVVRDSQGRVVGQAAIIRDLTEEKAKESGVRRADRLASLGTLLSGLAHELNNPLTSIKSFAQLLLLDDRPAEDRDGLEVIRQEADRAARLVADLRLLARQTRESSAPHREATDLNRIVAEVLESRRASLAEGGIELREDLTRDLSPVWGDRNRLEEMIRQLVVNAEQAVLDGSAERRLIVRTRPSRKGVALTVIDSGAGISPAHLERIFDPFWTTKAPGEGVGLGLSMVHTVVTEHAGEIRVESEVGRGSAFTVELPWAADSAEGGAEEPDPAARPLRVLVVEDEAPIRQSVTRYLERRGHHVEGVEDGRGALHRVDEGEEFDAILSDLRMPGMSGDELFRRLEERGDGLERRMIFVTGDPGSPSVADFLEHAGVPVLIKPFLLDEVAAAVERHARDG